MDAEAVVESQIYQLITSFLASLPQFAIALAVLAITWFLARLAMRLLGRVLRHTRMRRSLADVTVHLAPRQLWLIDSGRVFKGFRGCFGLPSNGICDALRA